MAAATATANLALNTANMREMEQCAQSLLTIVQDTSVDKVNIFGLEIF